MQILKLHSISKQVHLFLLILILLAGRAEAAHISGSVSISYSDGTSDTVADVHVFAVKTQELNAYLKPLLPEAAKEYAVLRAEYNDLVMHYSAAMTDAQKQEYKRKTKELFEKFDAILPRLLTRFPGNTIASTTTDADGKYSLNVSGDFYVTVLTSADDNGTTVHHIWLIPSDEIRDGLLVLDQHNEIPSITILYRKFYPEK
jgi:hypothetical protein